MRLAEHGVESVRVEVLARDLGVSKGSFYWHFRDRGELLEKLLARWEDGETQLAERRGQRRRCDAVGELHRTRRGRRAHASGSCAAGLGARG